MVLESPLIPAILSHLTDGTARGRLRRRRQDETRCHSHDVNRVTLSDSLLGQADGPIARRCEGRLVVPFMRRAETQCLWGTSDEQWWGQGATSSDQVPRLVAQ